MEQEVQYKLRVLRAGSLSLALFEDQITAIAQWNEPAPLPFAPASVLGVVSIEGRMLTVLDLASLVTPGKTDISPAQDIGRIIVALRGDEQLALAVNAAQETFAVFAKDIKAPKELSLNLFLGFAEHSGKEVPVLDVKELFPTVIHGRERRFRSI